MVDETDDTRRRPRYYPTPFGIIVDRWVEKATRDVIPEDRERIRDEVRAHVREVMEADGILEHEAVARLGAPEKAAARYTKTYLTAGGEYRLRWALCGPRILLSYLLGICLCGPVVVFVMLDLGYELDSSSIAFLFIYSAVLAQALLDVRSGYARRSSFRKGGVRVLVEAERRHQRRWSIGYLLFVLGYLGWGLVISTTSEVGSSNELLIMLFGIVVFGCTFTIRRIIDKRYLQKLRNTTPETIERLMNETPKFFGGPDWRE